MLTVAVEPGDRLNGDTVTDRAQAEALISRLTAVVTAAAACEPDLDHGVRCKFWDELVGQVCDCGVSALRDALAALDLPETS